MANVRHATSVNFKPADVYQAQKSFLAQIILDAILISKGERRGSAKDIKDARRFLQSERCKRWLDCLDIEPSCLRRIL